MEKINNWFKKKVAAISIALSNVEKNVFGQEGLSLDENITQQRRHTQGTLADSLLHGEINQEVKNLRWRTYKILKNSKNIKVDLNGYDENGNPVYTTNKSNNKRLLSKIKTDNSDNYPLELVFQNEAYRNGLGILTIIEDFIKENSINASDYFATNKNEKPLKITREFIPKFEIENYTKKLNIRHIRDNLKLIEFYISKYPDKYDLNQNLFINELKKIISGEDDKFKLLVINEVGFISNNTIGTDDFLAYAYNIESFDKIIEFDGYYVIKFISNVIIDGKDILSEYVEKDLDKKYEAKESKLND